MKLKNIQEQSYYYVRELYQRMFCINVTKAEN